MPTFQRRFGTLNNEDIAFGRSLTVCPVPSKPSATKQSCQSIKLQSVNVFVSRSLLAFFPFLQSASQQLARVTPHQGEKLVLVVMSLTSEATKELTSLSALNEREACGM